MYDCDYNDTNKYVYIIFSGDEVKLVWHEYKDSDHCYLSSEKFHSKEKAVSFLKEKYKSDKFNELREPIQAAIKKFLEQPENLEYCLDEI